MRRLIRILLIAAVAYLLLDWWQGLPRDDALLPASPATTSPSATSVEPSLPGYPGFLPAEAVKTLELIDRGGPFPYERDGVVFQNRERRLPERPRGYYREYTVPTPGEKDRGARRIVAGGQPPEIYYYTDDHYRSFREVEVRR